MTAKIEAGRACEGEAVVDKAVVCLQIPAINVHRHEKAGIEKSGLC
jgi:hypothetical protein